MYVMLATAPPDESQGVSGIDRTWPFQHPQASP